MSENLKDVLETIKESILKDDGSIDSFLIDKELWKELLNYITNLQNENEKLKKENTKLYKKDTKIINELKEELEITQEKWNKDKQWSECRTKEWLDYKSRCEKANKFIKEKISSTQGVINDYMYHKEHNKRLIELLREDIEMYKKELHILNGGDEE